MIMPPFLALCLAPYDIRMVMESNCLFLYDVGKVSGEFVIVMANYTMPCLPTLFTCLPLLVYDESFARRPGSRGSLRRLLYTLRQGDDCRGCGRGLQLHFLTDRAPNLSIRFGAAREVAPNQFEFAPLYGSNTSQIDQNLMVMQIIEEVASKHGLGRRSPLMISMDRASTTTGRLPLAMASTVSSPTN